MKEIKLTQLLYIALMSTGLATNAQTSTIYHAKKSGLSETELKRWSHLDLKKDSIPGMSVDKAYAELLKDKKGVKIIVGVIDSGVDIEHEDLKSVIWTNSKEIPNNKIDDDKNGYVDDIHGWNFLGEATKENLELTRIIKKGNVNTDEYKKAKLEYDKKYEEALTNKDQVDFILNASKIISEYLNKENYTVEDVKSISSPKADVLQSKYLMLEIIKQTGDDFLTEIKAYKEQVYDDLNYNLNLEFDGRKVVGDNPDDIKDIKYGNNNVSGPDKEFALHGTHVAGIIAQVRNNNLGGDGVSNNVEILVVRAVPNGDEYDKDIALAIRYAVDNGAKVINGSFGKSYSTHKEWVYDAIKYAEKKDVLIVHAAGNDGHNIDLPEYNNYPNDSEDNKTEFVNNMITVGALNDTYDSNLVADFSNYGSFNVDVFSPGSEIYATVPNNKYKFEQGTSMASPNVAGVASLIRSYYPKLSASQVKQILMDSGIASPLEVTLGETKETREFKNASKSGKMVNAYNALIIADKISKK